MSNARFSIIQARAIEDQHMTDAMVRLLGAYGRYSDKDGWCYPAQGTIAELLGWSRQKVNLMTKGLITLGYMESKARFDESGAQLSNMYRLLFDTPPVKNQRENFTPPVTEQEGIDYTNDPSNAPINTNTASGENQPSATLPLDWQILTGAKQIVLPDEKDQQYIDAANLLCMGTKEDRPIAYGIAYVFMKTRGLAIPEGKIKGNRKALKSMVDAGVLPPHAEQATQKLMDAGMTVVDLFSIEKTAIDLANKPAATMPSYLDSGTEDDEELL